MRIAAAVLTVPLALALALAAGCDADRDTDAVGDATPDTGTPPVDTPPPVPEPEPEPEPDTEVPGRFQGSYAADAAACDAAGHVSHLTIGSDTITFHESSGPITEVASGPSDITITAELTGEGETREANYSFRLSDDGDTLTDVGGGMARVRCD